MKTYQQLISELFDKPLKYTYTGNEDEAEYEFKTSSGKYYQVGFIPRKDDKIEIMFADDDDSTEITNAGNAIEVFSTVIAIIKNYIDAEEPESMIIEALAKEKSRVKLYRRLLKEFSKKYPDYKVTEKFGGAYVVWNLEMK